MDGWMVISITYGLEGSAVTCSVKGAGGSMSLVRVMVCAGHQLVISQTAYPGFLFNKYFVSGTAQNFP